MCIMENNIEIISPNGRVEKVKLVTYLLSEDGLNKYLVYTKGEIRGSAQDQIIYISKMIMEEETIKLEEIVDNSEWIAVQGLLKKIANS